MKQFLRKNLAIFLMILSLVLTITACGDRSANISKENEDISNARKNQNDIQISETSQNSKDSIAPQNSQDKKYQEQNIAQEKESQSNTENSQKEDEILAGEAPLKFASADDYKNFMIGEWSCYDHASFQDMAWLSIKDDDTYSLKIKNPTNFEESISSGEYKFLDFLKDENGITTVISLNPLKLEASQTNQERYGSYSYDGDYSLILKTICEDEILIGLLQVNNGNTMMFDIFETPKHIFRKPTDLRPIGKLKANADFYAICYKKDAKNDILWLDEVEYDLKSERIKSFGKRESLAYHTLEDMQSLSADADVEYMGLLCHVVTDENAKVKNYEILNYDFIQF